jgi:uncharacterized SAM-binding protein YcdF (DUF218 family)
MFFYLSKILLFLLSPFVWFLVALLIYFFWPNPKWKKRAKISAIVLFLFFSNTFIYNEFCRLWEVHGTPIAEVGQYEVGIVLGGMAEYNTDLETLSLRRGGDRIWQAITLYKKKKIKKILISGDSGYINDHGLHEAEQMKEVLMSWGIPEKDLIAETVSRNTYENALETQKILVRSYPHIHKCLLITSGRHMRRAKACFDKRGLACDTFSTDLYTGPERSFYWEQLFIPDVSNFNEWNGLIKEWVGYVTYDVVGYI